MMILWTNEPLIKREMMRQVGTGLASALRTTSSRTLESSGGLQLGKAALDSWVLPPTGCSRVGGRGILAAGEALALLSRRADRGSE
jgi:hypothetical protein